MQDIVVGSNIGSLGVQVLPKVPVQRSQGGGVVLSRFSIGRMYHDPTCDPNARLMYRE